MNVFVLTSGRSGSLTFAEACRHITNYSTGHETRVGLIGEARLDYPERHIEVDNRLAWFLGRLQAGYGDDAFYVHLRRDPEATAASHVKRWNKPAMRSFRQGILWDVDPKADRMAIARDLVHTMDSNIELYLRDKTRTMRIDIASAASSFPELWERIGAEGDLGAALQELSVRHHQGKSRRLHPRVDGAEAFESDGTPRSSSRGNGGRSVRLVRLLRRA